MGTSWARCWDIQARRHSLADWRRGLMLEMSERLTWVTQTLKTKRVLSARQE